MLHLHTICAYLFRCTYSFLICILFYHFWVSQFRVEAWQSIIDKRTYDLWIYNIHVAPMRYFRVLILLIWYSILNIDRASRLARFKLQNLAFVASFHVIPESVLSLWKKNVLNPSTFIIIIIIKRWNICL